jgi:predicted nucleic acid-binding protein
MYLDSAYIAKYYLNERDSAEVRRLIQGADSLESSAWALPEVHCVFHRHMRQGSITPAQCRRVAELFLQHVRSGMWTLTPVSESLLMRTASRLSLAPAEVFLRTGDAVHLTTAHEIGAAEIWTNDRHMLGAAPYFGLEGRTVSHSAE